MPEERPEPRLGRVEQVVLDELIRRGAVTPRDLLVRAAFPSAGGPDHTGRAPAEAAVSRAIRSLERKGLLVRERDAQTGRTSVRPPSQTALPRWEQLARAEEDLAAHCRRRATEWQALASRARVRARRLRTEQSSLGTEEGRTRDLDRIARLDPPGT